MDKSFSKKLEEIDSLAKKEENPFNLLGQYVPVHKYENAENNDIKKNVTSPFKKQSKSTLNIYDNDYLIYKYFDEYNLNGKKFTFWKLIKYLFFNLPLINILYLKIKESKIKKTINSLDEMSSDIDNYSKFLRNSATVTKPDFKNSHKTFIG